METATHVFNERLKRIEPTSNKCCYCLDGTVDNVNDNYYVPIFKENDRTNIVVYRSVKFSKILIGIPRCSSCKGIHESAKSKALVVSLIAALLIIAFTIYNFMDFHPIVSVIFLFAGIFAGVGGYAYMQNYFTRGQGIHTLKAGAEADPLVQDFIIKGWTFTQPSA